MRALLLILFTFFSALAFAQVEPIVIKVLESNLDSSQQDEYNLYKTMLESLDNLSRLEVVRESQGESDKVINYFAEMTTDFSLKEESFSVYKTVDSTQTITFNVKYVARFTFNMVLTSVETGEVYKVIDDSFAKSNDKNFSLKYKQAGLKVGEKLTDEVKKRLVDNARKKLAEPIKDFSRTVVKSLDNVTKYGIRRFHYVLFPFRVKVREIGEVKKDFAKDVKIAEGKEMDIYPDWGMVAFTIEKKEIDGREFEKFTILGKMKYQSTDDGVCDISGRKAGRKILAAMNEGKEVYASLGSAPYTVSEASEKVNLALVFGGVPDCSQEVNSLVENKIRNTVLARGQFNLLDRKNFEKIVQEKNAQKSEDFLDKNILDQFSSVGADLILDIRFETPKYTMSLNTMGTADDYVYKGKFPYSMKILDVSTGEVLSIYEYYHDKQFSEPRTNPKRNNGYIASKVLPKISFDLKLFFNEVIPPNIVVIEVLDEKKGKAKKVLVAGDVGEKPGDRYFVTRKTMLEVEGEMMVRFETIGELKLKERLGEDLMEGSVKEGEEAIYNALENDEVLYVSDKLNFFERFNSFTKNQAEKYGY